MYCLSEESEEEEQEHCCHCKTESPCHDAAIFFFFSTYC